MSKKHPTTDKQAKKMAQQDKKRGKAPTTQASHFVHEEMEHMKKGKKHQPQSKKQAVAIGLSKARRHGVPVKKKGSKRKAA